MARVVSSSASVARTARTSTTARTTSTSTSSTQRNDETRQLDRFQRAGYLGSSRSLKNIANQDIASAKDNVAKAADRMEGTVQNAMKDGQLRRSEMLEMAADDAGFQAAGHDLSAAKELKSQANAMGNAARDGKITAREQAKIDGHREAKYDHRDQARGLRQDETALRSEAAVARNDELRGDIDGLKARREQNLPQIKQEYRSALKDYQQAVQDAGGYSALKDAPPEVRDRVEGLRMKKDGAFKAVQASTRTGVMIRDAERAMADGKVSTAEQAGIDKQVRAINEMYSESDTLKSLGQAVTQQANTQLAAKAISSGNVRDLFTQPWGKELMADAFKQQMMMQMGVPFMDPSMMGRLDPSSGFGRSMFDMQQLQQMQLMSMFGGNQLASPFQGGFPFVPGMMDLSMLGMF